MTKFYPSIAAIVLALALIPHANAIGRGEAKSISNTNEIMIDSVEIDSDQSEIVLNGKHFGNTAPLVQLGDKTLKVSQFNQTRITATLPPDIRPATYRLTIKNTQQTEEVASLYFQIDAPGAMASAMNDQ